MHLFTLEFYFYSTCNNVQLIFFFLIFRYWFRMGNLSLWMTAVLELQVYIFFFSVGTSYGVTALLTKHKLILYWCAVDHKVSTLLVFTYLSLFWYGKPIQVLFFLALCLLLVLIRSFMAVFCEWLNNRRFFKTKVAQHQLQWNRTQMMWRCCVLPHAFVKMTWPHMH
jgi:hypothetical protein